MIYVENTLPIVNGYVQIPNSQFKRTRVTVTAAMLAILGAVEQVIGVIKKQRVLRLPQFNVEDGYVTDWYAALNAL